MVPSNTTDLEFLNYHFDTAGDDEIKRRFEKLAIFKEEAEGYESKLQDAYASIEEQSEFRRGAIEQILEFCNDAESTTSKPLKALIERIRKEIENSYVEL